MSFVEQTRVNAVKMQFERLRGLQGWRVPREDRNTGDSYGIFQK